jgi:hypothetical protein
MGLATGDLTTRDGEPSGAWSPSWRMPRGYLLPVTPYELSGHQLVNFLI